MSKQTKAVEQIEAADLIAPIEEAETMMEQADQIEAVEEADQIEAQLEQLEQQLEAVEQVDQVEQFTVEQVARMIVSKMEGGSFTLYRAHVAVNQVLEIFQIKKDGKAYSIRPQMMYNYNINKMIVRGEKVDKVTQDQLVNFIIKFVSKRVS